MADRTASSAIDRADVAFGQACSINEWQMSRERDGTMATAGYPYQGLINIAFGVPFMHGPLQWAPDHAAPSSISRLDRLWCPRRCFVWNCSIFPFSTRWFRLASSKHTFLSAMIYSQRKRRDLILYWKNAAHFIQMLLSVCSSRVLCSLN